MENETATWRVLLVDDDPQLCAQIADALNRSLLQDGLGHLQVEGISDFDQALSALEQRRFDILVLDVRLGPHDLRGGHDAGVEILEAVKARCFIPVVFYTGLPKAVEHLQNEPAVLVVEKGPRPEPLLRGLARVVRSRLPTISRGLMQHVEGVQRDYLWEFVPAHWVEFADSHDHPALAHLLARRVAASLSDGWDEDPANSADAGCSHTDDPTPVHALRYYVIPPITYDIPVAGNLYTGAVGNRSGFWVLATPSCDLVPRRLRSGEVTVKADHALLAECLPLADMPEYKRWVDGQPRPPKDAVDGLAALMGNNRRGYQSERFYFLPGIFSLPDLVVDLQRLVAPPRTELAHLQLLACLDRPFGEALLGRFARYYGRLGTPDLDVPQHLRRLQERLSRGGHDDER